MTIITAFPQYRLYTIGHLDLECNSRIGNGWPDDLCQGKQSGQKDQYEDKFSQKRWNLF